ncbi:SGNH/GDSL hydrolase family protein [Streptomyces lancefieldiae]|uniref:SGNH/GDSL hydrolase family protein n=1 Tax=Streptomyces lancefieldiae TaxID=3075520 RepID=A0ABU3AFW5_9ACTN|nr:SGNH/GDSL hydrolase family protein [Streptomyces sp. DSM 40712]MDT0609066.1 SGNH/GDSL hydrolase family protein [Streptomyces sp. DSM 40712]
MKTTLRTALATVLATGTIWAPASGTSASAAAEPLRYVALGDSYVAAPLVPPTDPADLVCLRSLSDYPHIAAKALGAKLTDVSCSGATSDHLSTAQHRGTAPQYDALTPDTDIVSVTIGGNDTDLFDEMLGCVNLLPQPYGTSCAEENTGGGTDKVRARIDAWAPAFAAVLDDIARRAPHAEVFVVGYGNYLRTDGCHPVQPFWKQDANYLQAALNHLGTVLKKAAEEHGAAFVDTYTLSIGHDICAAPNDRYTEGLIPTHAAAPLHPNAPGARSVGEALAAAVRAGR